MKMAVSGKVRGQHNSVSRLAYESYFDKQTGNLIRKVAEYHNYHSSRRRDDLPEELERELRDQFKYRYRDVPSPAPELIDVSITDKCSFGCYFCYQDSKARSKHGPPELVETLLKGLATVPYQIAIGGGEPTGHPDFISILESAYKLGTVPNYTTAGHLFRPNIADATNKFCGGVAMTYHSFKGLDWFEKTYRKWDEAITKQLNIHLIADANVAVNLQDLIDFQKKLKKPLSVVLLAYYPDVGRAKMNLMMTRTTYTHDLPTAIQMALESGMGIAFSEGLLPFFLSRPEIGVNTQLASRSEGIYSCYVDPKGRMSSSSFNRKFSRKGEKTIFEEKAQALWEGLYTEGEPHGNACYDCTQRNKCATPQGVHYLACALADHNKLPTKGVSAIRRKNRLHVIQEED